MLTLKAGVDIVNQHSTLKVTTGDGVHGRFTTYVFWNWENTTYVAEITDGSYYKVNAQKKDIEEINIDNHPALKLTSRAIDGSDYNNVCIIIMGQDAVYFICNNNISDTDFNAKIYKQTDRLSNVSFEDFYNPFRILK